MKFDSKGIYEIKKRDNTIVLVYKTKEDVCKAYMNEFIRIMKEAREAGFKDVT